MTLEGYYYPLPWKKENQYRESLYVGDCLCIERGAKYPFKTPRELDVGTTLLKGDPIMYLHIALDAYVGESEVGYARRLRDEFDTELLQLSNMVTAHIDFKDIKAFVGISHLAKIGERYGFTVFPVEEEKVREKYKERCMRIVKMLHPYRTGILAKIDFPDPLMAVITPRRLSELYLP